MIYPSIQELSKGKYNRYELCIATAKCARAITDELTNPASLESKEEKSTQKKALQDEKSVKSAILKLNEIDYNLYLPEEE